MAAEESLELSEEMIVRGGQIRRVRGVRQDSPLESVEFALGRVSGVWARVVVQKNDAFRQLPSSLVFYLLTKTIEEVHIILRVDRLTRWKDINE